MKKDSSFKKKATPNSATPIRGQEKPAKKDSSSKKKATPNSAAPIRGQEKPAKKDSSTKTEATPNSAAPIRGREKPAKKPQKIGSEIDAIFAGKKRKQPEEENKVYTKKSSKLFDGNAKSRDGVKKGMSSKSKVFKEETVTIYNTPRSTKKTADGLTIYSEEELGIGKSDAGGSALCPFDCDCCF